MKEIKRIKNFQSGETKCLKCGKKLMLYFNGGELDYEECCGLIYATKYVQIDLVVMDKEVK